MIKELLMSSSYWVLNKSVVKTLGIETAFFLTNLVEADKLLADDEGWFYQTIDTIEEITTLTRRKQESSIKELIKRGILIQENRGMPMKRYFKLNSFRINEMLIEYTTKDVQNVQTRMYESDKLVCTKRTTNKESINKELINKENIIKDIVEYLNLKTNSNYKHNTEGTVKNINARLKEGYTLEDFKAVIDKKTKQWLNDEKMSSYLRPMTLFGTKFESYLNEKVEIAKEKKQFTKDIAGYKLKSL